MIGAVFIASSVLCIVVTVIWDELRMRSISRSLTSSGFVVDRPRFFQRKRDDPVTRAIEIGARMRWHTSGVMNGFGFSLAESQIYGRRNTRPHSVAYIAVPVAAVMLRYSRSLLVQLLSRSEGLAPGWKLIDGDMSRAISMTTAIETLCHSSSLRIDEMAIDDGGILIACHRRLNATKVTALMNLGREISTIAARAGSQDRSITDSR